MITTSPAATPIDQRYSLIFDSFAEATVHLKDARRDDVEGLYLGAGRFAPRDQLSQVVRQVLGLLSEDLDRLIERLAFCQAVELSAANNMDAVVNPVLALRQSYPVLADPAQVRISLGGLSGACLRRRLFVVPSDPLIAPPDPRLPIWGAPPQSCFRYAAMVTQSSTVPTDL